MCHVEKDLYMFNFSLIFLNDCLLESGLVNVSFKSDFTLLVMPEEEVDVALSLFPKIAFFNNPLRLFGRSSEALFLTRIFNES